MRFTMITCIIWVRSEFFLHIILQIMSYHNAMLLFYVTWNPLGLAKIFTEPSQMRLFSCMFFFSLHILIISNMSLTHTLHSNRYFIRSLKLSIYPNIFYKIQSKIQARKHASIFIHFPKIWRSSVPYWVALDTGMWWNRYAGLRRLVLWRPRHGTRAGSASGPAHSSSIL